MGAAIVHGRHHSFHVKWFPHPAELMRPGVNFGVLVGWGFVLFVTSKSKRERVITLGLGATLGLFHTRHTPFVMSQS